MTVVDVKHHHERQGIGRVYGWQTISASAARRLADPRLRCPECKGAIGLYAASENKRMPERGEHKVRNYGCSLGDCFDGTPRLATLAIEPELESYSG
jgi:hypothetical protein